MKIKIIIILSFFYLFQQDSVNKTWSEQLNRYETKTEVYEYKEDFLVPYIQVENMNDKQLEEKINKRLKENSYEWMERYPVEDEMQNMILCYKVEKPEVTFQTARYLSVRYKYEQMEEIEKFDRFVYYNCITIDMKTGERVHLKELLKINKELVQRIKEKKALIVPEPDITMNEEELKEFLLKYTNNNLLERLNNLVRDDSMTEDEFINSGDGMLNTMLWKTSYNLTWEGISVNHTFAGKYQIIEKEYIKDYLYFDPWKKIW